MIYCYFYRHFTEYFVILQRKLMKKLYLILFFIAAVLTSQAQLQCDNDTTGLIPLIDLGSGTYMGEQGGLYPGGSNTMPNTHLKKGKKIAKTIRPLDTLGNVDWVNGKVIFVGMGASTAGNPWNHLMDIFDTVAGVNPYLQLVNACRGAKGIETMVDTADNDWYWTDDVFSRLTLKNVTPEQVQVIWMKTASKEDTIMEFPLHPLAIADKYETLMGILYEKFPNLKLVFITSSAYGGYADPTRMFYNIVKEPGSYWNGFGVKWAIERQISGDPDLKFNGHDKKAPFMSWGPYVWADGINPNSQGLFWDCETDFSEDGGGYHLTNGGKDKEALVMKNWAQTDPIAKLFFNDSPRWDPPMRQAGNSGINAQVPEYSIDIFPSPNNGTFTVQTDIFEAGYNHMYIVNSLNQKVWEASVDNAMADNGISVNLQGMPAGVYVVFMQVNGQQVSKKFILY